MSSFSTLKEAWGIEGFGNKRRKKRRKKKEKFQNYDEVPPSQGTQILNASGQNIYRSSYRKKRQNKNVVNYASENPSMNVERNLSISSFFFFPIALLNISACPRLKPDKSCAICMTCS